MRDEQREVNRYPFNSMFEGLKQTQGAFIQQIIEQQHINEELKHKWRKAGMSAIKL